MVQSGDGLPTPRRRKSIRSTGCSSNKMHGITQEHVKLQKASKRIQDEKGRTAAKCAPHETGVDSCKRRHIWSEEEDDTLLEIVNLHGSKDWPTIARAMPGRIGDQCRDRTGKAVKNHWNSGMKRKVNSYSTRGLLEQFQNLSGDTPILDSSGSSTVKGNEDSSKNNKLSPDLQARPKPKQGLTETGENATPLGRKGSDFVSAKGFGARSADDPKKMVCKMDTSKSPVVTDKKMVLPPSSVDLKVCVAAPSFLSEQKQMSSSCPREVLPSYANTVLSPARSSQSIDAHFDEICSGADKELTELRQADIADLLDMSYCESLMIIPPDSPHGSKCEHGM